MNLQETISCRFYELRNFDQMAAAFFNFIPVFIFELLKSFYYFFIFNWARKFYPRPITAAIMLTESPGKRSTVDIRFLLYL